MAKNILGLFFSALVVVNVYGCLAVIAGGAAGAGTAVWLSDKLTQQFNASYARTVTAAEAALKSFNLPITKEAREEKVTQLRSEYTDGKDIWIDVRKITENSTKVEVRVGAVHPDKEASNRILKAIQAHL